MENLTGILLNRHQRMGAGAKVETKLGTLVYYPDWWRVRLLVTSGSLTRRLFDSKQITVVGYISRPSETATATGNGDGTITVSEYGVYDFYFTLNTKSRVNSKFDANSFDLLRMPTNSGENNTNVNLRAFVQVSGTQNIKAKIYLLSDIPPRTGESERLCLTGLRNVTNIHFYVPRGSMDNYINDQLETNWSYVNSQGRLHEWDFTIID